MREIKFRFYPKNQITNFQGKTLQKMWEATSIDFEENEISNGGDIFKLDEVELMQYTGLKDKNWKELYEGDIYELKTWSKVYYRWYIRILDTYSGFRHKTIKTERVHRYKYWPGWNKFEIIWNIYENPELLNQ